MLETAERTSLQALARAELPGLYALARQLAGTSAEDLVQETLLRACRSIHRLRDPKAAPRWLRVILVNVWRDGLRKAGRDPREIPVEDEVTFSLYRTLAEEDPLPYSDTMHVDFLGAFSKRDVQLVLGRLPDLYRVPLVLRYIEGFSTTDIAQLLELPPGTVYSTLHRGRQRFERALWDYAEESGLLDDHDRGDRPGERGTS
ncbi:MAG: RNA polymerase sigma factor [Actinobacteria bacterium]|nr:RNA polymerase sigma factor [Actinomycetota bacterium]